MSLILVLSVTPDVPEPGDSVFLLLVHTTPTPLQKAMHVAAYAVLSAAWFWATAGPVRRRTIIASSIAVTFGIALEWIQTMVPGRFGTLYDVVLNTIGTGIGVLACLIASKKFAQVVSQAGD